jgi:branched-chain amino acid transport system permease protein
MPFVQLSGLKMHYVVHGNGPETILLVHGNLASLRWWEKLLPLLPDKYRVIAVDLRGCGQSEHTNDGYTVAQFAQDIFQFVKAMNLTKFHLLGHSLGGQTSLFFAIEHPEYLQTLAIADSVPAAGYHLDDEARAFFEVLRTDKQVLREAMVNCMPYNQDQEFLDKVWEDAMGCAPQVFTENAESCHNTVIIDKVGGIDVPTLIMHGREDIIIPLDSIETTIKAMPKAKVVIFEKSGHSPQIEVPIQFSQEYLSFLNEYSK